MDKSEAQRLVDKALALLDESGLLIEVKRVDGADVEVFVVGEWPDKHTRQFISEQLPKGHALVVFR